MKNVVIIGAGPAGITAGYELIKQKEKYNVTIIEAEDIVGGISKTISHDGNRLALGGHRFFSKSKQVNDWWLKILPLQGKQAFDYNETNRFVELAPEGPNPDNTDEVMLKRQRISRIFYKQKFFDYPIKLSLKTILNLGLINTFLCGLSYVYSMVRKLPETSLENFYINRFGRRLYETFFEGYTEKVWGKHPRDLSADWGAQRVKGLSITALLKNVFFKAFGIKHACETSLIEEFYYPKFGPGQMWETAVARFVEAGGKLIKKARVVEIKFEGDKITSVGYECDGKLYFLKSDILISSMPLKDLIEAFDADIPDEVKKVAKDLPYRDFVTVGMMLKRLKIKNTTQIKTLGNIVPDNWIYMQDNNVKLGRIQIFNNWSPYLVNKNKYKDIWLGLEYFCSENQPEWKFDMQKWQQIAVDDLLKSGIIYGKEDVVTYCVEKVVKAYPAYFGSYDQIDVLKKYLAKFDNLYCVGRNGQHRYNNMDHSMMTAFVAVDCINGKQKDKNSIWEVNTEKDYHESK